MEWHVGFSKPLFALSTTERTDFFQIAYGYASYGCACFSMLANARSTFSVE